MSVSASNPSRRRGFTLIEILVVVALIVLLIGILVPALAAAKRRARRVDNESLLSGISTAIQQYETHFNTFPGPPVATTPPLTMQTSNKMSGTQALLLALSYAWATPSDPAPNTPALLIGTGPGVITYGGFTVDPTKPSGPIDHGNTGPAIGSNTTGTFRQLPQLYTPSAKELSPPTTTGGTTWTAGGYAGTKPGVNGFLFPTILDHYSVQMPLLYYRGNPGVTGTATFDGSSAISSQNIVDDYGASTIPSFYRTENVEYTESTGFSNAYGTSPDQTTESPISATKAGTPALANKAFAQLLTGKGTNTTLSPKGSGYVLMSAGEDRIYGTSDDVIVNH
jgi:prepilin-type N-terminal cleavage/methylation domain-containing protein